VQAAGQAFGGWAATPPQNRAKILNAIADGIDSRAEELAQVETWDNGALLRSHRRGVIHRRDDLGHALPGRRHRSHDRALPRDVLLSGTPAGSRPVEPGDVVDVDVDGLGRLTSHVVAGPEPVSAELGAPPSESEEVRSTALGGDWEFRGIRPPIRQ
jgi:hypothetical protein